MGKTKYGAVELFWMGGLLKYIIAMVDRRTARRQNARRGHPDAKKEALSCSSIIMLLMIISSNAMCPNKKAQRNLGHPSRGVREWSWESKSYICVRKRILFEGFLEIARTGMPGLIAQFYKYHFWNLWEIWDRNMWTTKNRRRCFLEKKMTEKSIFCRKKIDRKKNWSKHFFDRKFSKKQNDRKKCAQKVDFFDQQFSGFFQTISFRCFFFRRFFCVHIFRSHSQRFQKWYL